MLKKFAWWFICFGLSFLVADVFGWTDQGRAFLYIRVGASILILLIIVLVLLLAGVAVREKLIATVGSVTLLISTAVAIAITLFATWIATKLFDVDFLVTYQIMTFGACLVTNSSSKSSSNSRPNSSSNNYY